MDLDFLCVVINTDIVKPTKAFPFGNIYSEIIKLIWFPVSGNEMIKISLIEVFSYVYM